MGNCSGSICGFVVEFAMKQQAVPAAMKLVPVLVKGKRFGIWECPDCFQEYSSNGFCGRCEYIQERRKYEIMGTSDLSAWSVARYSSVHGRI